MSQSPNLSDLIGDHIPRSMDTKSDHQFLTGCADTRYLRAHLPESELLAFHRWQQSGRRALDFPWSDEALALIDFELGVLVRLRDLMVDARANITHPDLLAEADKMRQGREGTVCIQQLREIHNVRGKSFTLLPPLGVVKSGRIQGLVPNLSPFPQSVEESQEAMLRHLEQIGGLPLPLRDSSEPAPLYKITVLGKTLHTGLPGEAATRMLNIMRDEQAGAKRPMWPTAIPMTPAEREDWEEDIKGEGILIRKELECKDGDLPPDFAARMVESMAYKHSPFVPYPLYEDMAATVSLYHGIQLDTARLLVARFEAGGVRDVFDDFNDIYDDDYEQ